MGRLRYPACLVGWEAGSRKQEAGRAQAVDGTDHFDFTSVWEA